MTRLPDCPKCSEPELWIERGFGIMRLKCRECGWQSKAIEKVTEIAATVAAASTPQGTGE